MDRYCIKDGYEARTEVPHFDDTSFKDEFQREVYNAAAAQAFLMGARTVYDFGCGSGFKLMFHFPHLFTIGFELEPALSFLRNQYPERVWLEPGKTQGYSMGRGPKLLICSDVIEHVEEPDLLLNQIASLNPDRVVISTPDRVELGMGTEDGPPRNIHHVREWTHDEFVQYLQTRFVIEATVRDKTTIVIGRPR